MDYNEILKNARECSGPYCKACPVCNGMACRTQVPGPGGKGTAATMLRNYQKWQEVCINMDTICENAPIDTTFTLFGRKFAAPIFAAPVGAMKLHYGDKYDDLTYNDLLVSSCAQAGIAAFARRESDAGELLDIQGRFLQETYGARVAIVQLPQIIDLSSTQVRALLRTDHAKAREVLWCQVYGYILRQGLYEVEADLRHLDDDDLRCASLSMVKAKRVPHIRGVEEEAVRLALHWGADPHMARRAGILHDCTKYLNLEEQLQLCEKYGIVLDELEQQAVKLLHSKTGACVARHVYGVSDDIYEAIFWHTTGKAAMTLLEKLLYIADYMEPTRDFPGVERLRALAYEDLDAAVLLGCEMSIQEMAERGLPVHPNTVKARDWLRSKTKGTSD